MLVCVFDFNLSGTEFIVSSLNIALNNNENVFTQKRP